MCANQKALMVPLVLNSEKNLFLTVSHVMITISGHGYFRLVRHSTLSAVLSASDATNYFHSERILVD